jgi:glycerol-3-phosphate dehydrogenase
MLNMLNSIITIYKGATKGNSGIVHAGYDDKPGSVRARFCWPGNQMFPQLDRELHFGYQRNGSLVLARNEEEEKELEELLRRGEMNGVKNLEIIRGKELFEMEPYISSDTTAALHAPDAGNLIPYEYAIALAENAVDNGVELRIR